MTQNHRFRSSGQVHMCLHRKPHRVQHSKAQRLRFNCSPLCAPPEARSIFEVKDTVARTKPFNGLKLKCLHCAKMLYINRTFYINKEQERTYTFSRKKKEICIIAHFYDGHLMVKFKMPINLCLVPLLQ